MHTMVLITLFGTIYALLTHKRLELTTRPTII